MSLYHFVKQLHFYRFCPGQGLKYELCNLSTGYYNEAADHFAIFDFMKSLHCLIITTSCYSFGKEKEVTWLEELAGPYFLFRDQGENVTLASLKGGLIPLDESGKSVKNTTGITNRFFADARAMYQFSHSLPLGEIKAEDYDLVFVPGGFGAMVDFPDNEVLHQLLQRCVHRHIPFGLVGHAVVALVTSSLEAQVSLVRDRNLTGFSNTEEAALRNESRLNFLLETRLCSFGARYSKAANFVAHVVKDGCMVTGQNAVSAIPAAEQTLAMARAISDKRESVSL